MLIGVKYCGGCKENFERSDAFNILKDRFDKQVSFKFVEDGGKYDAILVLSGCDTRCASLDDYEYNRLISIWNYDKVENAAKEIEDLIKS